MWPSGSTDLGVTVELWRDADPQARSLPGMGLGRVWVAGDWTARAEEFHRTGVRAVRIDDPVYLCGPRAAGSVGAVALVRELTSRGIAVDWTATCRSGCDDSRLLSHLWPPTVVWCGDQSTEVTRAWREKYFPSKCVFRRGPGFLEVRDRRWGSLELLTITDEEWIRAVTAMTEGAPVESVPAAAREAFVAARLTVEHAGRLWWLPAQVRRWPFPPMLI